MSRRNAKNRTQLKRTGRRPEVAKAAVVATAAALATAVAAQPVPIDLARRGALNALDAMPAAEASPSLRLARQFEVDPANYTPRERRAATYALDFNGASMDALSFVSSSGFPGFPTLVLLAQLPEYRAMHEVLADECIRTWGEAIGGTQEKTDTSMLGVSGNAASTSDGDQLKQINDEIERLCVRDAVRTTVIHDQAFGRAHPYFKIKGDDQIMDTPLVPRPYTVPKGSFQGLRVVEPYWVTPNNYNSINPVADDFYKPSTWWMIGSEVHATRLHTIVSRPVGDMLKPTYSFAGISMTQLAMPYIDNWLRTRQAVSDIVKQFSVSGILMDLAQALTPGANVDLSMRAELINRYRDNRNILFLDKATEEFFQFNTPLSGLDALQAQAQEQMSAVSHIPLIKLLGITPTGLNASSEGEIRVWYDYVRAYQRNALQQLMNDVIVMIQLSLFGAVDPSIKWQWNSLRELDDVEVADARYKAAQTDLLYIQEQVIRPDQVAARLNTEPDGPYAGKLDANDQPGEPADDDIDGILAHIQRMADGASTGAPPAPDISGGARAGATAPPAVANVNANANPREAGAQDAAMRAAGAVYVADGKVLLLKRPAGDWGLPAGKVEDGETPEEATRRETREETGYDHDGELVPLGKFDGFFHAFVADADTFDVQLNDEHTAYGWFDPDDLPAALHRDTASIVDAACKALARTSPASAMDAHWVTAHPNESGPGTPLLISGGKIVGGAGGKLNGQKKSGKGGKGAATGAASKQKQGASQLSRLADALIATANEAHAVREEFEKKA